MGMKRKVYYAPGSEQLEDVAVWLREKLERNSDFEDGLGNLLKAITKAYVNLLNQEPDAPLDS